MTTRRSSSRSEVYLPVRKTRRSFTKVCDDIIEWVMENLMSPFIVFLGLVLAGTILALIVGVVHQASLDSNGVITYKGYTAGYQTATTMVNNVMIPGHWVSESWYIRLDNGKHLSFPQSSWNQMTVGNYYGQLRETN